MTFLRFILFAFGGVVIGLAQWFAFNVVPLIAVLNVGLVMGVLLLVRQRVTAAIIFGCGVGFVTDIGSYHPFPVYTVSFLVCSMIILALFSHFVTHRSYLGYVLAGCIMFFGHRLMSAVITSTYGISFSAGMHRFPSIWLESIVSLVVYVLIITVLYQRWRVIHVDWPQAA